MIKILFVCHGNICRSPMAQYVMQHVVDRCGCSADFEIDSAATSREEIGNGIHHGTKRKLSEKGIPFGEHRARQVTKADYAYYDFLIGMEMVNVRNMMRIIGEDPLKKIYRMLDFTSCPGDIDDPWYTGNFDVTYEQIEKGCEALFAYLSKREL